jgi:thiol:disulfide interchange protein DsbD
MWLRRRPILALLLAIFCVAAGVNARAQIAVVGDGGPGPVKAQHLTAELVSLGPAIAPGGTQQVGLVLTLDDHWHVYWINPGDSGEPPRIAWMLPTGITAGPMRFPIPEQLPLGPLMDYGYEDHVAFPVTIAAAPTVRPGLVHLDAEVSWLVCDNVCVPGRAHLGIDLKVQAGAPDSAQLPKLGALGEALTLIPGALPDWAMLSVVGGKRQFVLTLKDSTRETDPEFYPYPGELASDGERSPDGIVHGADQHIESRRDGMRLFVQRSPDVAELPATLHGLLKLSDTEAYEFIVPVTPGEVAPARSGPASSAAAIGLAFLGGLLLNLMPCVFPVLFLKALALVQSSSESRAELRRHGVIYALGILVSFWAIVAVLLTLRATGSHAGWGFQLQSPAFLAGLASLIFFLALSLAGQFEIGLSLTSVGGSLVDGAGAANAGAGKQSYAGSFFTGVLATVVATPCTAPLMGAAIGFALVQRAGVSFAVFTALALGLAAPYLLLSWQPAWVRLLPRPGAWMELLKQFTSVPLFATAIWLAWVYGQLHAVKETASGGVDQMALLLACFLLLAIAGWALGRWPGRWGSRIAALVLIVSGLAIPLSQARHAGRVDGAAQMSAAAAAGGTELGWQPYSEQALDSARAAGRPVFIDFTADWCLSCKFNEQAVLGSAEVVSALHAHHVTLLKADWTDGDAEIARKLASLGRAGVPTYVLYPAAAGSSADVLPELLTKGLVLSAVERDSSPASP